jgi:hypothetical protein
MAQFKLIQEAVLRNSLDCELDRVELRMHGGEYLMPQDVIRWFKNLCVGDTITIEERETEVE